MRQDVDQKMRRGEVYHSLRVPDGCWTVLRVDGRAFHTHVKDVGYERPFDARFHGNMVAVAKELMVDFSGILAYTQSDECSVVLPPTTEMFDREVEKLVSVSASVATMSYNLEEDAGPAWTTERSATFDSRVWVAATLEDVAGYLAWRQQDSWRNCLTSTLYWKLRQDGASVAVSTECANQPGPKKHNLLHNMGINPANLPAWHRIGTIIMWEEYVKMGYNPLTEQSVKANRRRLVEKAEGVPHGEEYELWLREILGKATEKEDGTTS